MPNELQTTCDPSRIEAFLQQQLSSEEQSAFEAHLDHCQDCRERLETSAASKELWAGVRESLTCQPLTMDLSDSGASDQTDFSYQTILDWLAPTDDDRMLGRLDGYEIMGVVGSGGMGVVLKALDPALNRYVAIKVMAPHLGSSGAARRRFSREAQAAAAVVHENAIEIHGVSEKDGLPYLVMPYVSGPSLQRRLDDEGPLELAEILRIGMQASRALAAAHAQGLIHRDVTPANILLEQGIERVKLTDFGLARAADDASLTKSGVIAGTPRYMSPEQARGETIDQRSDLFSLGSVLYAMCTGRAPFRAETPYGVLRRITDDEPRPIREINPDIPEWLCEIVARLMSKDPDDRFQSAQDVAELLEKCLAHVQHPTVEPLPESLVPQSKGSRFSSFTRLTLTGLGLACCGILAFLLWQTTAPPDISGKWTGSGWGEVTLERTGRGKYSGTYTDTYGPDKGTVELKWSKVDQRYRGTWSEGKRRLGKISLEVSDGKIQGFWTASNQSEIKPGDPEVASLNWIPSAADVPTKIRNPLIGRWRILSLTKAGNYEPDDDLPLFSFSSRHLMMKNEFGVEEKRAYRLLEMNVIELDQYELDQDEVDPKAATDNVPRNWGRYRLIDRDTILLAISGGTTAFQPPAKAYPAPQEKNVEYYKMVRVSEETESSPLQNQRETSVGQYKRLIERRRYEDASTLALKEKERAADEDARQLWELRSKFAKQLVTARDNSVEEQKLLELMDIPLQRIANPFNSHTISPPQPIEVIESVERSEKLPGKSLIELFKQHPDNVRTVVEPVYDRVEEPRFYPLVGMARLHRVRFKCTLWFIETDDLKWPGPDRGKGKIEKTILIDHDHLIAAGEKTPTENSSSSTFTPFDCVIVDSETARPIPGNDFIIGLVFEIPKTEDRPWQLVEEVLLGPGHPGKFQFEIPEKVMKHPDRDLIEVRWFVMQPQWEQFGSYDPPRVNELINNDPRTARDDLKQIALRPTNANSVQPEQFDEFNARLYILDQLGLQRVSWDSLRQQYRALLQQFPEHPDRAAAMFAIASLWGSTIPSEGVKADDDQVIIWLRQAVKASRQGTPIWYKSRFYLQARLQRTDPDEAAEILTTILETNPDPVNEVKAWNQRVTLALLYQGDEELGEKICRQLHDRMSKSENQPENMAALGDYYGEIQSSAQTLLNYWLQQSDAPWEERKAKIEAFRNDYPFRHVERYFEQHPELLRAGIGAEQASPPGNLLNQPLFNLRWPIQDQPKMTLSFKNAPYPEVIKLLADTLKLSVQFDSEPAGTFSYKSDKPLPAMIVLQILNKDLLQTQELVILREEGCLRVCKLEDRVLTAQQAVDSGRQLYIRWKKVKLKMRVGDINTIEMTDVEGKTHKLWELVAADGSGFTIRISPAAEKALSEDGIDDIAKHFSRKLIEIEGRVYGVGLNLVPLPNTSWTYHMDLDSLDQYHVVSESEEIVHDSDEQAVVTPADLRFLRTKEIVLSIHSLQFMLDLDTGLMMDPPQTARRTQRLMDVHPGWDSFNPPKGLTGLSLQGFKVKAEDWNSSAADVERRIVKDGQQPLKQLDYDPDSTATFFFQTKEGGKGVLQLLALTEKPQGIRVRYKKLAAGANPFEDAPTGWHGAPDPFDGPEPRTYETEPSALTATDAVKQGMDLLNKRQTVTVRFQVDAVKRPEFTDRYGQDHKHWELLLSETTELSVIVTPQAETALQQQKIVNIPRYFTGKTIEIKGTLKGPGREAPVDPSGRWTYHINLDSLDQLRFIDPDQSTRPATVPVDESLRFSEPREVDLSWFLRLDLDTGKTMELSSRPQPGLSEMDVCPATGKLDVPPFGLAGFSLQGLKVKSSDWNATIGYLQQKLAWDGRPLVLMHYDPDEAATYFFRTQRGTMGVVQILSQIEGNPGGIRVRYKTLKSAGAPGNRTPPQDSGENKNHAEEPVDSFPVPNNPGAELSPIDDFRPRSIARYQTSVKIRHIEISPDGKMIAIANGNPSLILQSDGSSRVKDNWQPTVALLDSATGETIHSLDLSTDEEDAVIAATPRVSHFEVTALRFSPNGRRLAIGTSIGQLKLFDAATGKLITVFDDEENRLADRQTPENWKPIQRAIGSVSAIDFSSDGKRLAVCGKSFTDYSDIFDGIGRLGETATGPGRLKVFDLETGSLLYDLAGHSYADEVSFSPDGQVLASTGRWMNNREGGTGVILWNPQNGEQIRRFENDENGGTHAVSISPDGKLIAIQSVSFDKDRNGATSFVSLMHVTTGIAEWRRSFPGWTKPLEFIPDGKLIAILSGDKEIRFLDVKSGDQFHEWLANRLPQRGRWYDFAISTKSGILALGGVLAEGEKGTIDVWKLNAEGIKTSSTATDTVDQPTLIPGHEPVDPSSETGTITIQGVVLDVNRTPIAGAEVRLTQPLRFSEKLLAKGRTDKDSTFRFPGIPVDVKRKLVVSAPGHSSRTYDADFYKTSEGIYEIVLHNRESLKGRVLDPQGVPVAGAEVYSPLLKEFIPGVLSDRTDRNGFFEIPDLTAWEAASQDENAVEEDSAISDRHLVVFHPDYGYQFVRYRKVPSILSVQFEEPTIITGRVMHAETYRRASGVRVLGGNVVGKTNHKGEYRIAVQAQHLEGVIDVELLDDDDQSLIDPLRLDAPRNHTLDLGDLNLPATGLFRLVNSESESRPGLLSPTQVVEKGDILSSSRTPISVRFQVADTRTEYVHDKQGKILDSRTVLVAREDYRFAVRLTQNALAELKMQGVEALPREFLGKTLEVTGTVVGLPPETDEPPKTTLRYLMNVESLDRYYYVIAPETSSTPAEHPLITAAPVSRYQTTANVDAFAISLDGARLAVANGHLTFDLPPDPLREYQQNYRPVVEIMDTETGNNSVPVQVLTQAEADIINSNEDLTPGEARNGLFVIQTDYYNVIVSALEFSPDGKLLAVGTRIGQVKLFDTQTGTLVRTLNDAQGRLKDVEYPERWKKLERINKQVTSLSFSPDGKTLIVCGHAFGDSLHGINNSIGEEVPAPLPGQLTLWDVATGHLLHDFVGHDSLEDASFSPAGKLLVSSGFWHEGNRQQHGAILWDVQSGEMLHKISMNEGGADRVKFSPDGKFVALRVHHYQPGMNVTMGVRYFIDVETGKVKWKALEPPHSILSGFDPDNSSILIYRDYEQYTFKFFDLDSWSIVREIRCGEPKIGFQALTFDFTPDLSSVIVGGMTTEMKGVVEVRKISKGSQ